jgi:hypothetical protein
MIVLLYILIIITLIAGVFYYPLGILLMVADGFFHATATNETLQTSSPDHIISRFLKAGGLFDVLGFGVKIHRLMGALLIFSSIFVVYMICVKNDRNHILVRFYLKIVTPFTLLIIATAATLKLVNTLKGEKQESKSIAMFRI